MQTQNLLETPRIQRYSPFGSEKVFGAVNQQARQPLVDFNTTATLPKEVGCQAPQTTNGYLHLEIVV